MSTYYLLLYTYEQVPLKDIDSTILQNYNLMSILSKFESIKIY